MAWKKFLGVKQVLAQKKFFGVKILFFWRKIPSLKNGVGIIIHCRFNDVGFLRMQDLQHPHHYGTMQKTNQLGLVIVGGSSANYYTSVSSHGDGWTDGAKFPQSSNYGMSSVLLNGSMLTFGGYRDAVFRRVGTCIQFGPQLYFFFKRPTY